MFTANDGMLSSQLVSGKAPAAKIEGVQALVQRHFPHLWAAVEAGLSVCATLLLKDNGNPTALILLGPPSTGKTTVASMFDGAKVKEEPLVYRSDEFTAAAFVSQSSSAQKQDLEKIDLLPRIKHKVLLTPDLATIFKGKPEELRHRLSTITRVLDGQGFTRDSGTHGQRGYTGDYLFAWIGCTTPFPDNTWGLMAQLGSRLFFLGLETRAATIEDLVQSSTGPESYLVKLKQCESAVGQFLEALFMASGGVRGVEWDNTQTPQEVAKSIARFAALLAVMRTPITPGSDTPVQPEDPKRAFAVLHNIARGHALIHGRKHLQEEDLPVVARIALSSMPRERRGVIEGFALEGRDRDPLPVAPITVAALMKATGVGSDHTVVRIMYDMEKLKFAWFHKHGIGKASWLTLNPEWEWCAEGRERELILQATTSQQTGDEPTHQPVRLDGSPTSQPTGGEVNGKPQNINGVLTSQKSGGEYTASPTVTPNPKYHEPEW